MSKFFATMSRMKYINRWGLMHNTRTENLSEHTLEVAMLAHALVCIGVERLGKTLDPGVAVLRALYHDAAEILTGDLPTPIKYHDDGIKSAYQKVEDAAIAKLGAMLPTELQEQYKPLLSPEQDEYTAYVKAADKLSAVIKCRQELMYGNSEFEQALKSIMMSPYLKLEEAVIFIEEYLPAYSLTLDELGL